MLSKPDAGWSDFQLPGTHSYGLSYLNDLPFDWLEQAIHGLETLNPFTVEGFLEPKKKNTIKSALKNYVKNLKREYKIKSLYLHFLVPLCI